MCERYRHMNQAKRQLSRDMSWEDDTKKLRTSMDFFTSVSCLEDLSNELIYEILEYFTAQEIFQQFSHLNQRFENLIYHSNIPLRIHSVSSSSSSEQSFECLPLHTHRILSIHLSDRFVSTKFLSVYPNYGLFIRLQSLILDQVLSMEILLFLPRLMNLPRLNSLKISLKNSMDNPQEIYRLIFRLPHLRYNKISAGASVLPDSSSFINNEQSNSLEYLVIDHPCTLRMLYDILSCLPNLHHLISRKLFHSDQHMLHFVVPFQSFHLTRCVFRVYDVEFNQLEVLMKHFSSNLRVLHLILSEDLTYIDADRWERLFLKHMPCLQTLYYQYSDGLYSCREHRPHHALIHRFTSPFWMQKGWILNIETDITYLPIFELIYSIRPYKKCWYERKNVDLSQAMTQLTIRGCRLQRCDQWFIDHIRFLANLAAITSLHIEMNEFSIDVLHSFLQLLPHLDVLTIVLTNSTGITSLIQDRIDALSKMNHITKVNIEQHVLLNHVDILMNLCLQMQFLRIHCRNYSQMEYLLHLVLLRRKSSLSTLCFVMTNADELMVTQLQKFIVSENLIEHYRIQRMGDQIALYW